MVVMIYILTTCDYVAFSPQGSVLNWCYSLLLWEYLLKKKGKLLPLYSYLEECMLAYVLHRLPPQHKSVVMGWCVERYYPKKHQLYKV